MNFDLKTCSSRTVDVTVPDQLEEDIMQHATQFYIDGKWIDPIEAKKLDVIDPSTAKPFATISLGSAGDVDRAVAAAKTAFASYSQTTVQERIDLLQAILEVYRKRYDDMADAISREMGAPK